MSIQKPVFRSQFSENSIQLRAGRADAAGGGWIALGGALRKTDGA
jgi:hypothetical protein